MYTIYFNDMDNAISEIDYNYPMIFFRLTKALGKVITKSKR